MIDREPVHPLVDLLDQVLHDPEAYRRVFGVEEIHPQAAIETFALLVDGAVRGLQTEEDQVSIPVHIAAALVLYHRGLVKRPRHRPKSARKRRRELLGESWDRHRRRRERRLYAEMFDWAIARKAEIIAEARDNGRRISAANASLQAAEEAKDRYHPLLSVAQIAALMIRPGRRKTRSRETP